MLKVELLEIAGQFLFGLRWQTRMAREIGVADRTIRNWLVHPHTIPDSLPDMLRVVVDKHYQTAQLLLYKLDAWDPSYEDSAAGIKQRAAFSKVIVNKPKPAPEID